MPRPAVSDAVMPAWLVPRSSRFGIDRHALGESVDWPATIGRAARDHALPMLATALRETGSYSELPADVVAYLDYALAANQQSNAAIRREALEIGRVLGSIGVVGVLLKGAACLFDDGPAPADRMMRDIDILVPHAAIPSVRVVLANSGFRHSSRIITEKGRYHEPALEHPAYPASVEVHVEIATRPYLLPGAEITERAIAIAPGLAVPSLAHRLLRIVIHGQLTNGNFAGSVLNLKDATDFGRLVQASPPDFDWERLATMASERGFRQPLAATVHQAAYVTGSSIPEPFAVDARAERHLRRSLLQRRFPVLETAMRLTGFLTRALAWERDAYVLGLGDRRDFGARVAINKRRAQRAWMRVRRALLR